MTPLTKEWVDKAEGDYAAASQLARTRKVKKYDQVCFLSQQCVEKYRKARLEHEKLPIDKTHNLESLIDQLLLVEPNWLSHRTACGTLTPFAVRFRYPGSWATARDAKRALATARAIRQEVRKSLGL